MAGLMRREPHGEAADVFGRFDRLLEEWMRMLPLRPVLFSHAREAEELMRVEEFREDGTLVIRADLPGINPETDVELTVADGALRIEAERHAGGEREERDYLREEVRYGLVTRTLPLPAGVSEAGITADYRDGVLEVHVPVPQGEAVKRIAVTKS
jgi:HSP20 family protein